MNVSDIIAQSTTNTGRGKSIFSSGSFLNIGKRGQVVQGVVSKVADKVSISFNGTEAAVPLSSVQNATEGETRSFKIMEVSKDKIVLKEVGTEASSGSRAMTGTTVGTSSYSFADHLSDAGKLSEAKQQAGQNIAVLTGEDYQNMESEQGALEEYKASALDRAVERHKERREWQQESAERNIENSRQFQENIKTLQEQGVTQLMSPEEIENALREADLPITKSNVARVASAVQMAQIVPELSQDAKAYLLENQMAPTIENLYHGQYSASGALTSSMADEEAWQQLQGQIAELLQAGGLPADETTLEQAKWLFANDIAVTPDNVQILQMLDELSEELTPRKLLDQIIYAMQTGAMPEQATLDDRQIVIARQALNSLAEITDEDVVKTVRNMGQSEVTLQLLEQAVQQRKQSDGTAVQTGQILAADAAAGQSVAAVNETVTMTRRQLEELRLRLTIPAAVRMEQKGIDIEVAPLKELVDSLRQQERTDYRQLMPGTEISDEMLDRTEEVLDKASQISAAPASMLAIGARQHSLLTMNVLHRAAVSAVAQTRQYQADYEAVGTQVRTDLGDSIQKAFRNVPELLTELGMEDTQANQRAVRILGYNSMEITEQNVTQVKELDAQVGAILDQMKPAVVLKLVQSGEDPLDLPLQELEDKLNGISDAQDISSEERYTRYLMRMEQDQNISEQEREGYIGIYRLLHQVESSDGAAIGSVMEAGWDMTLRNLLTAVRTEKRKGVDAKVDDQFGGLSDIQYSSKSITQQIDQAFSGEKGSNAGQENRDETQEYYERLNRQLLREITPSAVQTVSDGDLEHLLDQSLEVFHDALDQTEPDPEIEKQLYSQMAQELRKTIEQSQDSVRYLGQLGIPDTVVNIQAAELLLEQNYDVYHQVYEKRDRLSVDKQQELADAMDAMYDSLEDAEHIQQSYDRLETLMETVLAHSYEAPAVTSEELRGLKQLQNGMLLQRSMARRHGYDVPIADGDSVATMNVTLIQGGEDSGRVQIYMQELSAELRIQQGEVKGLFLCGDREMYEQLSGKAQDLIASLEENGYPVKNISYSMNPKSRLDTMNTPAGEKEPATALYKAAKLIVKHVIRSTGQE